jgi:hypothetical protein
MRAMTPEDAAERANEMFDWYAYDVAEAFNIFPSVKPESLNEEFLQSFGEALETLGNSKHTGARAHLINLMHKQIINWESAQGNALFQGYNKDIYFGIMKLLSLHPIHESIKVLSEWFRIVCAKAKNAVDHDVKKQLPKVTNDLIEAVIIRNYIIPSPDSFAILEALEAVVSSASQIASEDLARIESSAAYIRLCVDDLAKLNCNAEDLIAHSSLILDVFFCE